MKQGKRVWFVKAVVPDTLFSKLCKGLVASHIRFADVFRGSLTNVKISALQRLPNCAFDIIEASKIKDSLI